MEFLVVTAVPMALFALAGAVLIAVQWSSRIWALRMHAQRKQDAWIVSRAVEQVALAQTEAVRRSSELERLTRRLELSNRELSRLNNMRTKFLSMVAHDLRTPLATIQGHSGLLAGRVEARHRPQVASVLDASRQIERLLSDLTDLAMIEAGKLRMEPAPFDLAALAGSAAASAALAAKAKGVSVRVEELPASLPVRGDRLRLQQVLQNLLGNAVKFTPARGAVSVRVRASGAWASVEVRDTGPGFSPAEKEALFEKFYQSPDNPQAAKGWGLGLSIAREIVAAHGGTIAAESPGRGRGSTFRIRIPAAGPVPSGRTR